jgi:hypothetical protein
MRKSHEKRQKSALSQHSAQKRARIFSELLSGHSRNRFKEKQFQNSIVPSLKYGPTSHKQGAGPYIF